MFRGSPATRREWRNITRLESKKQKFVERRSGCGAETALRFRGFLIRMKEALLAGGGEWAITFVADGAFSVIHANYCDANRTSSTALELHNLIPQVVDYPVDLRSARSSLARPPLLIPAI